MKQKHFYAAWVDYDFSDFGRNRGSRFWKGIFIFDSKKSRDWLCEDMGSWGDWGQQELKPITSKEAFRLAFRSYDCLGKIFVFRDAESLLSEYDYWMDMYGSLPLLAAYELEVRR